MWCDFHVYAKACINLILCKEISFSCYKFCGSRHTGCALEEWKGIHMQICGIHIHKKEAELWWFLWKVSLINNFLSFSVNENIWYYILKLSNFYSSQWTTMTCFLWFILCSFIYIIYIFIHFHFLCIYNSWRPCYKICPKLRTFHSFCRIYIVQYETPLH